eukprot:TRINITY_DN73596_c0_g1_i1.p1 TRINITY_DN73596_c0_g1~~TRINITY_DN73596_c0_g1_i1.p1  ORF type:complete len:406 (-),score=75.68 TRINITY_DN73596_c0_g1_i1:70-1287(-)
MGWGLPCTVNQGIKGNILRESVNFKVDIANHPFLTCLRAHLIAKLASVDGSFCLPKCHLEVWAEDGRRHPKDRELAYCRGFFFTDDTTAAFIEWLGRSRGRPAHESVRGLHCVPQLPASVQRTIPQAIIGVFAALSRRCGATALELEPQDDGSGKLMQYYLDLGFEEVLAPSKTRTMRAQIQALETLAPAALVAQLLPSGFDMREWFNVRARFYHLPCSMYLKELAASARRFEQCEIRRVAGKHEEVRDCTPNRKGCLQLDSAGLPGQHLTAASRPCWALDAAAATQPLLLPGAVPAEPLVAAEPEREGVQRKYAEHLPDRPSSRSGSKSSLLPALGASALESPAAVVSERTLPQLQMPSKSKRCSAPRRKRSLLSGVELIGNVKNLKGLENTLEILKSRLRRVD